MTRQSSGSSNGSINCRCCSLLQLIVGGGLSPRSSLFCCNVQLWQRTHSPSCTVIDETRALDIDGSEESSESSRWLYNGDNCPLEAARKYAGGCKFSYQLTMTSATAGCASRPSVTPRIQHISSGQRTVAGPKLDRPASMLSSYKWSGVTLTSGRQVLTFAVCFIHSGFRSTSSSESCRELASHGQRMPGSCQMVVENTGKRFMSFCYPFCCFLLLLLCCIV